MNLQLPGRPALHDAPTRLLLDPLAYVHPDRMRLTARLGNPRQRAVVNRLLLGQVAAVGSIQDVPDHLLLRHWQQWPYICALLGTQVLKAELVWRGRLLRLPLPVRRFMALSWPVMPSTPLAAGGASMGGDSLLAVQATGLALVLAWQQQAPADLQACMRLLFPPDLDACFDAPRRPVTVGELFLISQAIDYAKNYPYRL